MKPINLSDIYDNTPSRIHSFHPISYVDELRLNRYYSHLINIICQHLNLAVPTIYTAIYIYQYSITRYLSYQDYRSIDILQSCIYLSCKIHESHRRIRDIINVTHRITYVSNSSSNSSNNNNTTTSNATTTSTSTSTSSYVPISSSDYWSYRDSVLHYEQIILRCISYHYYDIQVPQLWLLHIAYELELSNNNNIITIAHSICNDTMSRSYIISYSATCIACACIYIAGELTNTTIHAVYNKYNNNNNNNINSSNTNEWWSLFNITRNDIEQCMNDIVDIYDIYYNDSYYIGFDIESFTVQVINNNAPPIQQSSNSNNNNNNTISNLYNINIDNIAATSNISPQLTPVQTHITPSDSNTNTKSSKQQQRQTALQNIPTFDLNESNTPKQIDKTVRRTSSSNIG